MLFGIYIVAAELSTPPKGRGEFLVFRRGAVPHTLTKDPSNRAEDEESASSEAPSVAQIQKVPSKESETVGRGTSVFHWEDLCYDVEVKGQARRLLDHVDGWVKPGKSTALMVRSYIQHCLKLLPPIEIFSNTIGLLYQGVSGAGKTTLLDVLATRVTMGVVSGATLIDGLATDASFQHRVGYVQQQDLHLATTTVREALEFSALLRQPAAVPRAEKLRYVDEVVDMLGMRDFAGAVVGMPGEGGLNVEQRKRLTIGVELAARPELLVFLDEPTSGLDSQTSWAICDLIEKLTRSGQAILCTIHQPSAMLFQRFDRLLLLASGGKTVYFGGEIHSPIHKTTSAISMSLYAYSNIWKTWAMRVALLLSI